MKVHYMAVYYSQWAHENLAPRTQKQWDAFKYCRAVKNRRINGTLTFPWKKGPETISQVNVGRARAIFGSFISRTLQEQEINRPVLVPVPSKDGLLTARSFRSLEMLEESLTGRSGFSIAPVLRFNTQLQSASSGGPRGRNALLPHLVVQGRVPRGTVVLVDDIITTGGSLLASYDRLVEASSGPEAAIVCGHTVSDSLIAPFGIHSKEIDTDEGLEGW